MKTLLSIFLIAFLIGCQQTNQNNDPAKVESRLRATAPEPHLNILAGSKMHGGKLTDKEQDELADEGNARMAELRRVSPFPMLREGEVLPLSLEESDAKYVKFISENAGKSILPLFRQLYARAILNDYKLLDSDDYTKIKYYVDELIKGESFDFRTITLGLVKLNRHADANDIKLSIKGLMPIMKHRLELEEMALAKIKTMNGKVEGTVSTKNPTAKDKELLLGLGRLRNKLENSDTVECINILNGLNSELSNS
jgi:hypothetical protein